MAGRTIDDAEAERALDALAGMVRAIGEYTFDREGLDGATLNVVCERWAKHVLHLSSPSGSEGEARPAARAPGRRDFVGLQRFVVQNRREEVAWVRTAIADLRQLLASFVARLQRALPEESAADQRARLAIEKLRAAASTNSFAELQRIAFSAAETIETILEQRHAREEARLQEFEGKVRTLHERLEVAEREVATDPLTRLANRRVLDEHISRASELAGFYQQGSCLLLLDIDHFKQVNDTHGHQAGDAVLVRLADAITRTFPRKGDCLARYGGEEFAIVLRDATLEDGVRLAERLRKTVQGLAVEHQGQKIRFTVSIGVAAVQSGEASWQWVQRADRALYAGKAAGRDRVVADGKV
jgi:diguanylate cyclase